MLELLDVKLAPGQHPNLNAAQLQQLHDLSSEFADVFTNVERIGCIPAEYDVQFRLKLKPGTKPVKQQAYRFSKFEEDWLFNEIQF